MAPEFKGVTEWLQTIPLALSDLAGKVVGIEFWAVGCGNCQRALPHMQKIYEKYGHKGFVLIGVHAPEFASEKNIEVVKKFLLQEHITFPIAIDNDHGRQRRVRLLGVAVTGLEARDAPQQLTLDRADRERKERVSDTLDRIRERFGAVAVNRAIHR